MKVNKNIREQRNARTARLKSRVEASNQQIQHLNHHYFQIPLPEHQNAHPYFTNQNRPTNQSHVSYHTIGSPELDERKQLIKQKIKFRVKQELWNLLKKNSHKEEAKSEHPQTTQKEEKEKKSQSAAYIMGKSFTRVSRDSLGSRRNWYYQEAKKKEFSSPKDLQMLKRRGVSDIKPRRAWSSSVKMRDRDKAMIERRQIQINKSYLHMQKMDSYNIQPWKAVEDPEHHFME